MANKNTANTGSGGDDHEVLTIPGLDDWRNLAKFQPIEDIMGQSVRELGEALGKSEKAVRTMIRNGIDCGEVEFAGKQTRIGIAGQKTNVPVYRLKQA